MKRWAQIPLQSFILALALVVGLSVCHGRESGSIQPLERYAVTYAPCKKPDEICMELPQTPKDVAVVLQRHVKDDAYKRHVTLILLKLYRAQLENYHKSFELRRDADLRNTHISADPLIEAFASFSGASLKGEFISSDLAYVWVVDQPELLHDPLLAVEVKQIRTLLVTLERQSGGKNRQ